MNEPARSRATPTASGAGSSPVRILVLVGLAAVVVLGVVVALARGGDDDDGGDAAAEAAAFGPVTVEGTPLPAFEAPEGDEALGLEAPVVQARTPDGADEQVGGASEEPTLLVFLAHWCPHCQAEVPVLVEMAEDGAFEGVRLVGVLTGTRPDAPNFPPAPWLEREGWPGEVLLDDDRATAAAAFGLTEYPFLVVLDEGGEVVARTSGEQPPAAIEAMLDAAGASDAAGEA